MKVDRFLVERFMDAHEHDVELNLAETCVKFLQLRENNQWLPDVDELSESVAFLRYNFKASSEDCLFQVHVFGWISIYELASEAGLKP
ncbi:MAG: hypothetical protein QXL91_07685 [Candidatus Bathyarchaeia archaeon]